MFQIILYIAVALVWTLCIVEYFASCKILKTIKKREYEPD